MDLKLLKICALLTVVAGMFYFGYSWHTGAIREAVSVSETKMKETHRQELETALRASNQASKALQANADIERQKKDEKIADINAKLSDALRRLSNRPSRPSTLPEHTDTSQACTARELYREDGEFLAREASRAESVLIERDYYYQQYEEVRRKLNAETPNQTVPL